MSDLVQSVPQAVASEPQNYEADLEQVLAEVHHLNTLMQQDRGEIERLRGEAWLLREETRTLLAGLGAQL